jgi:sulfatase modifying factor 1
MKKSIGFILSFLLIVLLIVSCTNLADLRNANNANLENLSLSEGTLSPVFNATKTSYTVTVPYATTSLTVTGTKADSKATMTPSDGKLSFTGLSVGTSSEQTIKLTSEDGSVINEYKVKVVRQSNDATLSALTTSTGTLSPAFNAATTSYTITVPYATTSLTVTGTKADTNATMTPSDGKLSFTGLSVGTSSEQTIKLTSEDGSVINEYKVKVVRQSNDATLSALTTSTGTLSPAFNAATTSYTITVPYATTSLTVTGTKADANATMTPSDGKLSFTGLSVGTSSEQTIKVTSQDGNVTNEYKVKVLRQYIEMVPVPAGRFQRDAGEENISVITKPYSLSKYQITRQQFKNVMGTDPSSTGFSSGMNDPVQCVNWYHAIAFCNKLSIKEGLSPAYTVSGVSNWANLAFSSIPTTNNATWNAATCNWDANGYRLPTEMEWMWAAMGANKDARAGAMQGGINTTGYSKAYAGQGYGAGMSIDDYAWYDSNSSSKTHPVGGKLPNELGLYDMSGNVWEWCWDWYASSYQTGTLTDYRGAGSGSNRVARGGSWFRSASYCTVAHAELLQPV